MSKKIKRLIIVIVVCICAIVTAYCVRRFINYYQNMCVEVHERVIRWYIDNDMPPYEDFESYEEYEEYLENGGEDLATPY